MYLGFIKLLSGSKWCGKYAGTPKGKPFNKKFQQSPGFGGKSPQDKGGKPEQSNAGEASPNKQYRPQGKFQQKGGQPGIRSLKTKLVCCR